MNRSSVSFLFSSSSDLTLLNSKSLFFSSSSALRIAISSFLFILANSASFSLNSSSSLFLAHSSFCTLPNSISFFFKATSSAGATSLNSASFFLTSATAFWRLSSSLRLIIFSCFFSVSLRLLISGGFFIGITRVAPMVLSCLLLAIFFFMTPRSLSTLSFSLVSSIPFFLRVSSTCLTTCSGEIASLSFLPFLRTLSPTIE